MFRRRQRPASGIRAEVPAELDEVVLRMIAKNPQDRYATPADVVEALTPFAEPATGAAPPRGRGAWLASLGSIAALLAIFFVARVETPLGTVEVRADDAIAADVEVSLMEDGELVEVVKPGEFTRQCPSGPLRRRAQQSPCPCRAA